MKLRISGQRAFFHSLKKDGLVTSGRGMALPTVYFTALVSFAAMGILAIVQTSDARSDGLSGILLDLTFLISSAALAWCSIDRKPRFGLQMIFIYYTVFFILPAVVHDSTNSFPFYAASYDASTRTMGASIAILFIISFGVAYLMTMTLSRVRRVPVRAFRPKLGTSLIAAAIATAALGVLLATFPVSELLSPRSADMPSVVAIASDIGVLLTFPRSAIMANLIYSIGVWRWSRLNGRIVFLIYSMLLATVGTWPLALPRFLLAGYVVIIAFLLIDFFARRRRIMLTALFLIGAFLILPFVDNITRGRQTGVNFNVSKALDTFFKTGDFDGFQSVLNIIMYVHRNGHTWGGQLVSAALFFVPRTVWVGKGEPSGSLGAQAMGFRFANLSAPLPAEFYIDFGWAGVVVLAAFFGMVVGRLDRWIQSRWEMVPLSRVVGGLTAGFAVIVLRGSLLGIVAPTASTIVFVLSLYAVSMSSPVQRKALRVLPERGALVDRNEG